VSRQKTAKSCLEAKNTSRNFGIKCDTHKAKVKLECQNPNSCRLNTHQSA
jgi:hypothetical protein